MRRSGGAFPAAAHEQALDKLTMLTQQHSEEIVRALKIPVTDEGIETTLATTANRANKLLSFDENGDFALTAPGDDSTNTATAMGADTPISHASRFGQRLTVKDFGATGNGTTDDRAAIAAALTAAAGKDLYFPAGNWQIFDVSASGTFDTSALASVNVKWWGPVGDGSTDDTAEIQACIDSGGGANTYVMHFPAGTYITSDTLNLDEFTASGLGYDQIYFVGEGRQATRIALNADNKTAIQFKAVTPDTDAGRFHKCGIHDMAVTVTDTGSNGYCLDIEGMDQFSLHNCQISSAGTGRTLMRVYEFTNSWIAYNEFNGGGLCIEGRTGVNLNNYFNMIQNNQFLDFEAGCMDIDDCDETMIQNNWISAQPDVDDAVIRLRGDNRKVLVSGNHIQFSNTGIRIEGAGARVMSNSLIQLDDSNTFQAAIRFTSTATNPASTEAAQKSYCVGNVVALYAGGQGAIFVTAGLGDIDIIGNVCSSIDNGASIVVTLNSTTTKNVRIEGNTVDTGQFVFSSGTAADASVRFRPQDNRLRGGNRAFERSAAPTSDYHEIGERVENTAVAAGGSPGWVCTTAGTPGTWKAEANIAA